LILKVSVSLCLNESIFSRAFCETRRRRSYSNTILNFKMTRGKCRLQ